MGIEDITNPLNQAEGTLKAARGVLKEGKGLIKDIAETAEEYQQYKENKDDKRAIRANLTNKKATERISKRNTNAAIADHDAAVTSAQELAKQVLIKKKAQEEESAMIWAMTADEREAYLEAKRLQTEKVKAEKLKMIREADEAQARFDLILNIFITIILFFALAFGGYVALDYFLAGKLPWRE